MYVLYKGTFSPLAWGNMSDRLSQPTRFSGHSFCVVQIGTEESLMMQSFQEI